MQNHRPYPTVANSDGAVILDAHGGHLITLNQTAARIWQAIQRGQPTEEIASQLAEETGMPVHAIEDDMRQLLADLKALGLSIQTEHKEQ
ncbi:PqqD family protein [Terriglobus albidus]|uniref:PqqD family protein n=1 Tax=Terriglobus albidus TaxID=1592106 RepID=UPI0021E0FC62|nr:PqqD family protein [Terriglobus albidus]